MSYPVWGLGHTLLLWKHEGQSEQPVVIQKGSEASLFTFGDENTIKELSEEIQNMIELT